ncbi:hypothetical protein I3842_Q055400 [Carya illinoinensis]|uniref:Uncharacterized protein n=1 Tax=Carya illinoinensis TaxID=32201 RepID=A0A922D347_CARIL|nr:hypothetical protein I3842_Q055400 [Carya illinoinensis]
MVEQGDSSVQPFQVLEGTIFDGYSWRLCFRERHFSWIREECRIPETTMMEALSSGYCDDEGFSGKVVVIVSLLSHGLRRFFWRPLRDILDLLGLASAQLHPFALRAYVCDCIVFRMVLEPLGDPYFDLIAWKFDLLQCESC